MEALTPGFIQEIRGSDNPKDLFRSAVINHITTVTGAEFDEHDRAAEVNIYAEVYLNTYQYAADEMRFDARKVVELLKITHSMMDYRLFLPAETTMLNSDQAPDFIKQSKEKFDTMRQELLAKSSVFTAEEIRQVAEYFTYSFIGNIRLYSHSLSGKQRTDTKVVSVFVDEPIFTLPLLKAVERIKMPKEELSEATSRFQRASRKATMLRQLSSNRLQTVTSPRAEEDKEQVDEVDQKISTLTKRIDADITQHDQQIERTLEDLKPRKK